MKTRLVLGIFLFVSSTLCYHIPSYVYNLDGYDFTKVPEKFYSFYCLFLALQLFLIAVYAFYLLIYTETKYYKTKMLCCWMFATETSTFLDHVIRKYVLSVSHSNVDMAVTIIVFTICFSWVLRAVLHVDKSAKFFPDSTYILKFRPKNLFGVFNHLVNLRGHAAIYQDGLVYKFRRKSGRIEPRKISPESVQILIKSGQLSIENIPRNRHIKFLTGRKYRFFTYNCNHLAKDARRKA